MDFQKTHYQQALAEEMEAREAFSQGDAEHPQFSQCFQVRRAHSTAQTNEILCHLMLHVPPGLHQAAQLCFVFHRSPEDSVEESWRVCGG